MAEREEDLREVSYLRKWRTKYRAGRGSKNITRDQL